MSDKKKQSRQRSKQRKKKKSKRRLRVKKRRKDIVVGMPFIVAYQGDPARHFRCGQNNFDTYYDLIPQSQKHIRRNPKIKKFNLLKRYQKEQIQYLGSRFKGGVGLVHIKNAPA